MGFLGIQHGKQLHPRESQALQLVAEEAADRFIGFNRVILTASVILHYDTTAPSSIMDNTFSHRANIFKTFIKKARTGVRNYTFPPPLGIFALPPSVLLCLEGSTSSHCRILALPDLTAILAIFFFFSNSLKQRKGICIQGGKVESLSRSTKHSLCRPAI